jgi:hypothetical protein
VTTGDEIPQWSDETVAESFRAEIRARFEAHNKAFRARENVEMEQVLRDHPEKRGVPGFEVHDSIAWEIYQAAEIRIERNAVTIVLPRGYAISIDVVHLFDHTTVAWSRPMIGTAIVDGEVRTTIEIVLVATWTDEMQAAWRQEGNDKRQVLVELDEDEVRTFLGLLEAGMAREAFPVRASLPDRLRVALEYLP